METGTVTNVATASFSHMSMSVEISSPVLVWGASILWCVIVAIVTGTLAERVADAATGVRRFTSIAALILCGFVLVMVAAEAEREVATRFYLATTPRVSSVGIWNDFPRWPSGTVAAASVVLTLIGIRKRKAARTSA